MRSNAIRLTAVLLVCGAVGAATGQPPVGALPSPLLPGDGPAVVQPTPAVVQPTPPPAPPPTVDVLIEQLTKLRAEKAELEKREQAVVKALREKLQEQKARLAKLGINEPPPVEKPTAVEVSPGPKAVLILDSGPVPPPAPVAK